MTRIQTGILCSIFVVCASLIAASYLVTGTAAQRVASTEVLSGAQSLADAVSGTYARSDDAGLKQRQASAAKKRPPCDPAKQTCLASKQKKSKVETVTYATGYRTLCVRLCDGYYFPISSAVSPSRFAADSAACQSRCSSPARLFVYKNTGGSPATMVDLEGRPYAELKTAFLHRTSLNPACTCKAAPWTEEATNTHRVYALEDAMRKGDKDARAKLALMRSVVRQQSSEARIRSGAADVKPVTGGDIVVPSAVVRTASLRESPIERTVKRRKASR